jgi:hypothetical protein
MSDKFLLSESDSRREKILLRAHQEFYLDFYGTKIWTPYRINIPFQPDRRRYGKESAKRIRLDTIEIAKEHSFDLKEASAVHGGEHEIHLTII